MTFCPPTPGSPFVAVPCPSGPNAPEFDTEPIVLCDVLPDGTIAGTALAVYVYDESTGMPVGPPTFVIPGTNTPYVAQGILRPCDEPCLKCDTAVLCDNTQTPASEIVASTIKMLDTPNVAGNDGWNVTAFNTANAVNTPQVCPGVSGPPLPVPYPAFYNADWCTAWLAGCPGGTAAGGGCALNPGPALGLTSDFESINCGTGSGFSDSCSRYLVEKTFNTDAACTRIRVTSQRFRADGSAKVMIDGQDTGIFGAYNMTSPDGTIILTVAPGTHTMTIDLRDSEAPTWIQGGLTIECLAITPAQTTSVQFLRTTCRTCTGNIVSVTDTTLDGQTPYVPGPTVTICDPGAGNIPQPCANCESFVLADRITNLTGQAGCISFLRRVCHNCDGTVSSITDTLLDGTSPYSPQGSIGLGCDFPEDEEVLCDAGANYTPFLRTYIKDTGSNVVGTKDSDLNGSPYTVVGPVVTCIGSTETQLVCDGTSSTSLVAVYHFDSGGILLSTLYYGLDGSGPFVPAGPLYEGGCCQPVDLGESCYDSGGGVIRRVVGQRRCHTDNPVAFDNFWYDTETGAFVPTPAFVDCPTSAALPLGEVCYSTPIGQSAPFTSGMGGGPGVFHPPDTVVYPNFGGSGVDVTLVKSNGAFGFVGAGTIQFNPNPGDEDINITFSKPVHLQSITIGELDNTNQERWYNFNPPYTGATGALILGSPFGGAVSSSIANGNPDGDLLFGGALTSSLTFKAQSIPSGLGSWLQGMAFTLDVLGAPSGRLTVVKCDGCSDTTPQYFDVNTGAEVINPTIVDCPPKHVIVDNFPASQFDFEEEVLCDDNGPFFRRFTYTNGVLNPTPIDFTLAGAAYATVGTVHVCTTPVAVPEFEFEEEILCDNNGSFIRRFIFNTTTQATTTVELTLAGAPYAPVGTVHVCTSAPECENTIELIGRCDYTGTPGNLGFTTFFERLTWDCNGVLVSADAITATGTPYTPTGTVKTGLCEPTINQEILCDSNGTQFLRRYSWTDRQVGANNVPLVRFDDFALDGSTAFTPVGAVGICPVTTTVVTERDVEIVTLCDDNGGFLRRFVYDEATGLPTAVVTTDFAGNPYVTVGTVKVCDQNIAVTELDAEIQFMCDSNGPTSFLRRYLFNEATGAIGAILDFTLAGAAYVSVGTVTAGACVTATVTTIDETIARQTGAGSITIAAGARSVTLVVLTGAPTAAIAGSTTTAVPAGVTLTWAVDSNSQTLLKAFSFTGIAGDDFIITTTR